jgi:hypothetical protein
MPVESRVKRWRDNKRQQGLKHVSVWLALEEEMRLKDLASQWHCSPSAVVQQALAQFSPQTTPGTSTATDLSQIRELIRAEFIAMQAEKTAVADTVTEVVTDTLARDLPGLVRQLVEGLALEALGLPVTDTTGDVTETVDDITVTHGDATDTGPAGEAPPGLEEAPRRSMRRGGLKLTPQQEAALRAKRAQGTPIKALMEEYGISKATLFRYLQ